MGGIEFLDDPAPPSHAGPDGPRPGGGRRVLIAFVLAGVVLVGLLVGRAVTSGGRHALPAPATPSTATASSGATASSRTTAGSGATVPVAVCRQTAGVPVSVQTVDRPSGSPVTIEIPGPGSRTVLCSGRAAQCPEPTGGRSACVTSTTVPRSLLAVVRKYFPTVSVVSALTETLRTSGELWFRYVHCRLPRGVELAVETTHGHPDVQPTGEYDDGGGLFSRAMDREDDTTATVTVTAPSGTRSTAVAQFALARALALVGG